MGASSDKKAPNRPNAVCQLSWGRNTLSTLSDNVILLHIYVVYTHYISCYAILFYYISRYSGPKQIPGQGKAEAQAVGVAGTSGWGLVELRV